LVGESWNKDPQVRGCERGDMNPHALSGTGS
jgi:hypothetical protein